MADKKDTKGKAKKRKGKDDWELEKPLDLAASLEELIEAPPFKEASDQYGHSATAGTRIPFWLERRLRGIVEMPGSPYGLMSDVFRDCIFIGARVIHMRYAMSKDWDVEARMAATVDAIGEARRIRKQFEDLASGLDEMHRDGDDNKAAEHLTDFVLAAVEIENDWHREKVFNLLQDNKTVRDIVKYCPVEVGKLMEQGGK